jgi:hypothetical protein
MDKIEFTITEIASQLNVSRQYIYKKLSELEDQLEPHIVIKNKIKYIKIDGVNILKDIIKNNVKNYNMENIIQKKKEKSNDNTVLIYSYENQINFLKDELVKKDEFYNKLLENMQKESLEKNKLLENIQKESLEKNKLLENMQVLLKDQKLLIDGKENRKWWKFWKS